MGYISGAAAIGLQPLGPDEPNGANGGPLPVIPPKIEELPTFEVPEKPDFTAVDVIACPPSVFDKEFWINFPKPERDPFEGLHPTWEELRDSLENWKPRIEPPEGYYPYESRSMQMDKVIWGVPELHVPGQSSGDVFFV